MTFPHLRLAAAVIVLSATAATAQQPTAPQPVATPPVDTTPATALTFQGATVIDVETGRRLPDQTIVVVGNRIRTVGPTSRVRLPPGARVIRADGTFVIPGLWDMHVHIMGFPNTFFPLFIANGVTGVRDMGSPFLDSMLLWRREVKEGRRAGPRLVTAGPSVADGKRVEGLKETVRLRHGASHAVGADTPEEGRRVVDSLKQGGADFIKVYSGLERDVYFAILAEARRVGLPVAGHLPASITPVEASDSGQHSLEHAYGLGACLDSAGVFHTYAQCRALASRFRRNDTWVQLGPARGCMGCELPWYREQGRYVPDSVLGTNDHEPELASVSLGQWADRHREAPRLRWASQAGIRFLAGTDVAVLAFGVAFLRPGFALHDLLREHVRQGLTPLEALQAATLNPARYFQATDSMGTIAPGKVADLVFLDADPLVDIFNTRRIRAVVADGRFYDRADLDSLLIGTERLAKQSRRP